MRLFFFAASFCMILSCSTNPELANQTSNSLSNDVKIRQYLVEGRRLYTQHCVNCHMENGQGLAKLIPPLANSSYMLEDIDRTICIIKFGISGEIEVNKQIFNHPMPGFQKLTDLEIAEIATYIYNSWGNEKGMISISQVKAAISECK